MHSFYSLFLCLREKTFYLRIIMHVILCFVLVIADRCNDRIQNLLLIIAVVQVYSKEIDIIHDSSQLIYEEDRETKTKKNLSGVEEIILAEASVSHEQIN